MRILGIQFAVVSILELRPKQSFFIQEEEIILFTVMVKPVVAGGAAMLHKLQEFIFSHAVCVLEY